MSCCSALFSVCKFPYGTHTNTRWWKVHRKVFLLKPFDNIFLIKWNTYNILLLYESIVFKTSDFICIHFFLKLNWIFLHKNERFRREKKPILLNFKGLHSVYNVKKTFWMYTVHSEVFLLNDSLVTFIQLTTPTTSAAGVYRAINML